MFDFLRVSKTWDNKKSRYVYAPKFVVKSTIKDLMIRSKDFYAIFNEETGLWETDDSKAIEMIDRQVREYAQEDAGENLADEEHGPLIKLIADTDNRLIDAWHRFCQKDLRDRWVSLDQKIIFSNQTPKRDDYASKKLSYPLQEEPAPYYNKLCEQLYLPEERDKWEWFIGCIIAGDSRKIQKMLVFYGEPGTGKSTIIGKVIAENLLGGFDGYATKFEANNLASRDSFGTDFLEHDSVLAYDDDAELGMISSKTTLNKIISHESIRVNAKFKSPFIIKPNCLLIVGSNEPVQMSPNSGMNRRLIDVRPTGNRLSSHDYDICVEQLPFERSGIAWQCLQTYKKLGRHYYDHYIAEDMLSRTSPFQNFVVENYFQLKDGVTLANAYRMYTEYAEACKFKNVLPRYKFRDTLKLYFQTYENMKFDGLKVERIGMKPAIVESIDISEVHDTSWLNFNCTESLLDEIFADCPAQYANDSEHPSFVWNNVKTKLKDLDTGKLHYVLPPSSKYITIDLDIHDPETGEKSFELNKEAASKFPPTYAELSKSGQGIHLTYIYTGGDPEELACKYAREIEVKVFAGKSSLRRMVTKCNDIPIATMSSGLPLKERKKVLNEEGFENEKKLIATIKKALRKEYDTLPSTKTNIDFIEMLLKEAYTSGKTYDVRCLQPGVRNFALNSTNRAQYCLEAVSRMFFCSKDVEEQEHEISDVANGNADYNLRPIIFLDCEIFPSYDQALKMGVDVSDIPKDTPALFLVNWKLEGEKAVVNREINPSPDLIHKIFSLYRIIGFNNRNYDNHMLYARSQGFSSEELFNLSQRLVGKEPMKARFGQAYNISYTDIYDFMSAGNKMSLKKWEIKLGLKHLEWNHPWDKPVPVNQWIKVAEYCDNDVLSTEAVFNCKAVHGDFIAREILAALAEPYGGTVNSTTNQLTNMIVFEGSKNPGLVYTDFSTGKIFGPGEPFTVPVLNWDQYEALGDDWSGVTPINSNHFPGYHLVRDDKGKLHNMYRGVDVKFGGYVYATPNMYGRVITKDVASMHPHSIKELNLFGDYTKNYVDLMEARVLIKHKNYAEAKKLFHGALAPYLTNDKDAKALSNALKTALNSAYGLTSAKFKNMMRDPRNVNNIVALRGALVMKTLQDEVEKRGFTVVHIKTDSIKIASPTKDILDFIDEFGKKYGYTYEVEHTWERLCLVNDAVYVGKHDLDDPDYISDPEGSEEEFPGRWEAIGAQFKVPYVFKSLFTHRPIIFDDLCTTFNVQEGSLHLIFDKADGGEEDEFIGRVGLFTPMREHGGTLYRIKDDTRSAPSGTKGYFWMESDRVKSAGLEDCIDENYYKTLCDEAIETISQYGDFTMFAE